MALIMVNAGVRSYLDKEPVELWGLLTALFLYPTGWIPNETMAKLISPILTYFLPTMIGYTAGENIYGKRGGVISGLVTMGVIVGTDITMFMGAMIVGPLAAVLMKWVDSKLEGKAPAALTSQSATR